MKVGTYGKVQINSMLNITPGNAIINPAFWIVVDVFMPSDFPAGGITTISPTTAQLNSWAPVPHPLQIYRLMSKTITPVAISSDDASLWAQQHGFTFGINKVCK